jgi:hypothetical protein
MDRQVCIPQATKNNDMRIGGKLSRIMEKVDERRHEDFMYVLLFSEKHFTFRKVIHRSIAISMLSFFNIQEGEHNAITDYAYEFIGIDRKYPIPKTGEAEEYSKYGHDAVYTIQAYLCTVCTICSVYYQSTRDPDPVARKYITDIVFLVNMHIRPKLQEWLLTMNEDSNGYGRCVISPGKALQFFKYTVKSKVDNIKRGLMTLPTGVQELYSAYVSVCGFYNPDHMDRERSDLEEMPDTYELVLHKDPK